MAEESRIPKTSIDSTMSHKTLYAKMKSLLKKKSTANKAVEPLCNENSTTQVAEESANWFDESKVLKYEDLKFLSNNFSPDNDMGRTYIGRLYRGIIPDSWKGMRSGEVTIKLWEKEQFLCKDAFIRHLSEYVKLRLVQEIKFLQQPDIAAHPCTVNVMGYCLDDNELGVVYDLKPFHTLKYCIDNSAGEFVWAKRVSIAMKLAYVLKFFHEHVPEYTVRNLSPAHVMLDQDLNPVLIDYALIHGGSLVDPQERPTVFYGSHGYLSNNAERMAGGNYKLCDIHSYGVILLEIMREITFRNDLEVQRKPNWTETVAWVDYLRYKKMQEEKSDGSGAAEEDDYSYSYAHESMKKDTDYDGRDGNTLSMLGLRCVEKLGPPILSMDQVLEILKGLKIVERHPELLLDVKDH